MNATYYLIKSSKCPICDGQRLVIHPSWSAFWEKNQNPTDENIERWFHEEGYNFVPNEEIPCDECGGQGVIRREVNITEALSFLEDRITNLEDALKEMTS